ncbi:hypothetical protein SAMN05216474_0814 [Lishizhenia tianjinensis]|uniref:Uncharacterized protein n=1 Tax=Lishizhenia tianjinensis TaxID=477690 RepID=A0A1I6YCU3_9FLAO|nr:hypothetical protein SAMN05216474_0814 [Lishizhenia tianjinensis]
MCAQHIAIRQQHIWYVVFIFLILSSKKTPLLRAKAFKFLLALKHYIIFPFAYISIHIKQHILFLLFVFTGANIEEFF